MAIKAPPGSQREDHPDRRDYTVFRIEN